jgi:glycosyltransferase involved in cell wall biosynthesis
MRWLVWRLGVPSIIHVRTPVSSREVRKHRLGRADVAIAISARVRRNLLEAGVAREKVVQIDDGVDPDLFAPPADGDVLGRDYPAARGVRVGIVGRVSQSKRQHEFLQAAQAVQKKLGTRLSFFVIGRCPEQGYYKKLERLVSSNGLLANTFFTGHRDDMPQVLRSLDIVVSLSGGSVMFEAMSCERPVISAGFTSPKDAVHIQNGRTGMLVPSRSQADLADALALLVSDASLRRRLGTEARRWVVNKLTCQEMTRKTQTVYAELLAQGQM